MSDTAIFNPNWETNNFRKDNPAFMYSLETGTFTNAPQMPAVVDPSMDPSFYGTIHRSMVANPNNMYSISYKDLDNQRSYIHGIYYNRLYFLIGNAIISVLTDDSDFNFSDKELRHIVEDVCDREIGVSYLRNLDSLFMHLNDYGINIISAPVTFMMTNAIAAHIFNILSFKNMRMYNKKSVDEINTMVTTIAQNLISAVAQIVQEAQNIYAPVFLPGVCIYNGYYNPNGTKSHLSIRGWMMSGDNIDSNKRYDINQENRTVCPFVVKMEDKTQAEFEAAETELLEGK